MTCKFICKDDLWGHMGPGAGGHNTNSLALIFISAEKLSLIYESGINRSAALCDPLDKKWPVGLLIFLD